MNDDPRLAAARYRAARDGEAAEAETDAAGPPSRAAQAYSAADRAAVVETAIQQAMRRGDFDDLPGAGKPIPGLGESHDPDWWIRRKIETENLTGLGPPALMLRVENLELGDRLDELAREQDVRETVEDFNRRVIEARRQLLGGPPVVTPVRDVETEVAAWAERRQARLVAQQEGTDASPARRRPWWRRRGRE
ncbi:DUF1992 domain-containing protein [Microbacterium atlanticum]|uniref:DnaJ family domain-containing protein n=1 Tax=Microbacterium atlanticum TaxID=2782168 RepID=UPI0018872329|nr:DUF1992 domain-containing protein [Microbacterium atlanticum]